MEAVRKITVYSTHCPKCRELEEKLKHKGLLFEVVDDQDEVLEVARQVKIAMVPFVIVHEVPSCKVLDYNQALQYFEL